MEYASLSFSPLKLLGDSPIDSSEILSCLLGQFFFFFFFSNMVV
jgi:hypothetical protein